MSMLGITFVVGALSLLTCYITSAVNDPYPYDTPWLTWTFVISFLLLLGATVSLIIQIGMVL